MFFYIRIPKKNTEERLSRHLLAERLERRVGDNLGYNLCFAVACPAMSRRIVLLRAALWSAKEEEDFTGENDKVTAMIRDIAHAAERRGIYVYDRSGGSTDVSTRSGLAGPISEWG